jgi:hypothetical protein
MLRVSNVSDEPVDLLGQDLVRGFAVFREVFCVDVCCMRHSVCFVFVLIALGSRTIATFSEACLVSGLLEHEFRFTRFR